MIFIYTLSCPDTLIVRYVGKTKNIKLRLQSHIDYSRNTNRRRHVSDWIKSLLRLNKKPIITCIEETTDDLWVSREQFWIRHFRSLGFDLCNLTDGGESNYGYKYSNELKEVRRLAKLGWVPSKDIKDKISLSLSKKVICIDDNIIYPSMKEAIKSSGVPKSTFHRKLHKGEKINSKLYEFA
jgi:hypothetical protein